MIKNTKHTIAILAYNNHKLTRKNLNHLIYLGYKNNILLFDNGSNPSYKNISKELKIRYHREEKNIFVNPAWNFIFEKEHCDYLTLLNNDCFILSENYFLEILYHMKKNCIGISSCKTKNVSSLKKQLNTCNYFYFHNEKADLQHVVNARRQGWLMTIDMNIYKTLNYLIPNYLKIWYGDDWIWGQFLLNNYKTTVYKNRYAIHLKSSSLSSKKIQCIIEEDNNNLNKFGNWHTEISPLLHKRTRLLSRYV